MMKKHLVEVDVQTLHEIPITPPRKRLWDFVPDWLALFIVQRLRIVPKPTPYELWTINNAVLRMYYKIAYDRLKQWNQWATEYEKYQEHTERMDTVRPEDLN